MTAPVQVGPSPVGGGPAVSLHAKPAKKLPLTPHQIDVLQRIAEGHSWERISRALGITVKGVGSVVREIWRKLGAVSSAHAVLLACQAGLLDGRPRRHGDHAGFAAHRTRGEEPCEACWDGERAYRRVGKATRKAAARNAA